MPTRGVASATKGVDVPQLAIPEHGDVVHIERLLAAVGQDDPTDTNERKSQLRY